MKKNDIITVKITDLLSDGNGVGHVDGLAVFVPLCAINDLLEVRVVKVLKNYAFAIIHKILLKSNARIELDCDCFGKCGGCDYRHINYSAEIEAKTRFVNDAFRKIGKFTVESPRCIRSPEENKYRNKAQFPLTYDEDGNIVIGFFARRSHRVIPCNSCFLQPDILNEIANYLCGIFMQFKATVYDESIHKGVLRHIFIRRGANSGEVMISIVVNAGGLPFEQEMCDDITSHFPQVKSIMLSINREETNVILGNKTKILFGKDEINDTLCGVPVSLSAASFYQINTAGAAKLYEIAQEFAELKGNETLLDLYCGTGTIGLSMVNKVGKLIGVDNVPEAIENAVQNSNNMKVKNATFIASDAGEAAIKLANEGLVPDIIIVDPPRKGCDKETLNAIVKMKPAKVVMISCDPATAARDCRILCDSGYELIKTQAVDMFARTKHVETVVLLSHKKADTHINVNVEFGSEKGQIPVGDFAKK